MKLTPSCAERAKTLAAADSVPIPYRRKDDDSRNSQIFKACGVLFLFFVLYWMNLETGKKVRLTYNPGADVLPVFSPDGGKVMWTSTRTDNHSAQLFLADFTPPREE
jgi:hypothetical protein